MLRIIADYITYSLFRLETGSKLAESVDFFLYDSMKILVLLFVMISSIGFLRSFVSQNKVRRWLEGKPEILSNIAASLFGALTPFCSCSSIPLFLSFIKAGLPLGATFSFLIASPLINEYLVVLMIGFFGFKITGFYIVSGLVIGILSGLVIGRMKLEKNIEKDFRYETVTAIEDEIFPNLKSRVLYGINEGWAIVKNIWKWVLFGVGVGAIIHNYIPSEFIQGLLDAGGIFTVPLATIIGIPMYGGCAAIVPIAVVLFKKGLPLGTALAFMMAVSALSLPEAIILKRAMNLKLIAIFFGIVFVGITFTGYLINWLAPLIIIP